MWHCWSAVESQNAVASHANPHLHPSSTTWIIKNQRDYMPKLVFVKHSRVYIHLKATLTKSPEEPQPEVWKLAELLQEMQNW
jgi:hypothetical protein